ncbi:amino acid-binding protein [Planctomycetales bacterium]|nr:amino acid-binding protein [Planctomycetales bacterium]
MQYVLSVMSSDHPGIVAGVSGAVSRLGGNINSCSQTVLGGYFTFITIIDLPQYYEPEQLAAEVQNSEGLGKDYQVLARQIEGGIDNGIGSGTDKKPETGDTFVITAFGKDQSGIVKNFSRFLAGHDININDLYGYKTGDEFVLVGQLTVPENVNISNLQGDLEEMGSELGFTVKLQHNNIFVVTNQLRVPD